MDGMGSALRLISPIRNQTVPGGPLRLIAIYCGYILEFHPTSQVNRVKSCCQNAAHISLLHQPNPDLESADGMSPEFAPWGAFTNDVSREGEGGGYPNSDAVREVA